LKTAQAHSLVHLPEQLPLKAQYAKKQYENALHLLRPSSAVWSPPVKTCSALEHSGIDQVWDMILSHRDKTIAASEFSMRRKRQSLDWMWSIIENGLQERFEKNQILRPFPPVLLPAYAATFQKIETNVKDYLDETLPIDIDLASRPSPTLYFNIISSIISIIICSWIYKI